MPIDLSTPGGATLALLPELVLTIWGLGLLLLTAWRHRTAQDTRLVGLLVAAGLRLRRAGHRLAGVAWCAPGRTYVDDRARRVPICQ